MPKLSFQYVEGPHGRETLVQFLSRRFRYHTAEEWTQRVRSGHVTVNGERVAPDFRLRTRHRIVYERPPTREPAVDPRYSVVYEDEELLAVSKSGNMPTSPSGKYWDHCLVHHLQRQRGLPRLHAVHRLDRETSGVNLLAKTRRAARVLGEAFGQGDVEKEYVAVLQGLLPVLEAYVSAPLQEDARSRIRIKQAVHPDGREARTRFTLLAWIAGASLVRVKTLTGRTHQIRAHAHHLGHPVVGDKLYGRPEAEFLEWVGRERSSHDPRHLLHASTLVVRHPATGEPLRLHAPADALVAELLQSPAARPADR